MRGNKDFKGLNILLLDNWRLRSDTLNIILQREEEGKVQEQYFYSSISGAIESLIEKLIKRFDVSTLEQLNSELKTLLQRFTTLLRPLNLKVSVQETLK